MLDEDEYAIVAKLYSAAFSAIKDLRQEHGLPLEGISIEDRFCPVIDAYEQMTGLRSTNANAIMHHRLLMYGPPSTACGKPLRTPSAAKCMACGAAR